MLKDTILKKLSEGYSEEEIANQISKIMNETFTAHKEEARLATEKEEAMHVIFDDLIAYFNKFYPEVEISKEEYARITPVMIDNFEHIAKEEKQRAKLIKKREELKAEIKDQPTEKTSEEKMREACGEEVCESENVNVPREEENEPKITLTIDTYEKRSGEPAKRTHDTYTGEEASEVIRKWWDE